MRSDTVLYQHRFYQNWHFALQLAILTLSLPGVISHKSLTKDISYSVENLAFDSLLRWKLIELSILTTPLMHLFLNS